MQQQNQAYQEDFGYSSQQEKADSKAKSEKKLIDDIEYQNRLALYKAVKPLRLDGFKWQFKGEADLYRRRPFPKSFLQPEASAYPCYLFNSELSKAFNSRGEIAVEVDIAEFKIEGQRKPMLGH